MRPQTPTPDLYDQIDALPDLRDVPLNEPWLRHGQSEEAPPTVPTPTVDSPRKVRRRWRRVRRLLGALVLLGAVGAGGVVVQAKRQFDSIERVPLAPVLAAPSAAGTNYLIVGTDSRDNLNPDVPNAEAIFGDGNVDFGPKRTDTIQILRVNADGSQHMLALPRDLFVPIADGRGSNRINAAYAFGGGDLLVRTIQGSLGIPIHHYAEVDFAGFIDLVDSVGGVTIDFPHPASDPKTGLNVPAGPVTLDSTQALAFVRSRTYTETIDGVPVLDRRSDLGRVKRQQQFLQALATELKGSRAQFGALSGMGDSLGAFRVDDRLSFTETARLANDLKDLDLNTDHDLVVSHFTTNTGAQVLALDTAASQATLDFFSR